MKIEQKILTEFLNAAAKSKRWDIVTELKTIFVIVRDIVINDEDILIIIKECQKYNFKFFFTTLPDGTGTECPSIVIKCFKPKKS